ncbi:MAG: hypothetical protein ACREFD_10085, partial [Stellaceae bacterium]
MEGGGTIRTTHTGSLPRSPDLLQLLTAGERGEPVDDAAFERLAARAVADVVRRQWDAGIDLVSDGEQAKPDYSTYIKNRMTGFEGEMEDHPVSRDARDFPDYFAANQSNMSLIRRPCCTAPLAWRDRAAID